MTSKLLRLFNKSGVKATPDKVLELRDKISAILWDRFYAEDQGSAAENKQLRELADACTALLAQMEAIAPDAATTPTPRTTAWDQAADKGPTDAAIGSLRDAEQARHRPSGKVKPRPRWSLDELTIPPTPSYQKKTPTDERNYRLAVIWAHRQK